ncbi:MAG: hypothetical protein AAGD22_11450 [Verrucomicrobiota bacterium]
MTRMRPSFWFYCFFAVGALGAQLSWAGDKDGDGGWFFGRTLSHPKKIENLLVDPSQPVTVFRVPIKNTGDKLISGYRIAAGCSCFVGAEGEDPIPPGETKFIDLWFHTSSLTKGKKDGRRMMIVSKGDKLTFRYGKVTLYWRLARPGELQGRPSGSPALAGTP